MKKQNKTKIERHVHPIPPIYDNRSTVLILGSFPSSASRKECFYYAHPQNRFWRLIARIFDSELPNTEEDKRKFLLDHGVALWDVIAECDISGSSDNTIRNVRTNDLSLIFSAADINAVFTNGNTAAKLYEKYLYPITKIKAYSLPSTSPANAAYSMQKLYEKWKMITEM